MKPIDLKVAIAERSDRRSRTLHHKPCMTPVEAPGTPRAAKKPCAVCQSKQVPAPVELAVLLRPR